MPLDAGTRLGPYEIVSALGAGGMGEVYKARDTRLDRTVAIKVLPADLAGDPDRRARFEREAKAIAALDHPHICALHDVGEQDDVHYLVMQHLDGETLAARLGRTKRPLPLAEALTIATEIADALDKAHGAGITHRDLKPANIMLTKTGAKLLDFGLAKLRGPAAAISMSVMERATVASTPNPATATGTILGTVHYMAPEQVEGRDADARSDIWALGAVIYEMATGARPFDGESAASIIGAILKDTPPPISARQPLAPLLLDHVVERCLDKDPDERWQTARDLVRELRWVGANGSGASLSAAATRARPARFAWLGWAVAGVVALTATGVLLLFAGARPSPGAAPILRFSITPPPNAVFASPPATVPTIELELSPDGKFLAFVAEVAGIDSMLWVRPLDAAAARAIAGTEDASFPFWSPDSRSIGFFAQGKLKRVDVAGGPVQTICDSAEPRGGAWGPGGVILLGGNLSSIRRVSANGGSPAEVTTIQKDVESDHRWPSFLPDGEHFLFLARGRSLENSAVEAASLDGTGRTRLFLSQYPARFVPSGHLLFPKGGALLAQPFDPRSRTLSGEAVPVAQDVGGSSINYGSFSASNTGLIAWAGVSFNPTRLTWFGRAGNVLGTLGSADDYADVRFSSDDRRATVTRIDAKSGSGNVWIIELGSGLFSPLTFDTGISAMAVWSPDSRELVYRSNRETPVPLYRRLASGAGRDELLLRGEGKFPQMTSNLFPTDWSPDGRFLLFHASSPSTSYDIWSLPMTGDPTPRPLVTSRGADMHARFSPDGRFFAYTSAESGRQQVFVQPFPPTGGRWQVSTEGGFEPVWRADGRELYFIGLDRRLMAAPVRLGESFAHESLVALFTTRVPNIGNPFRTSYDAANDGQRFLVRTIIESAAPASITVLSNWPELLKR